MKSKIKVLGVAIALASMSAIAQPTVGEAQASAENEQRFIDEARRQAERAALPDVRHANGAVHASDPANHGGGA